MNNDLSPQAYQELIKHTVDILMVVDESGTIQYQSPAVQRITGYAPEERAGGNVFENVHPDDQQKVRETFSTVLESSEDEILQDEFRFRHKDGSWIWLESRGSTQTVQEIDGFVVTLREITKRKEYEQRLERERNRLDRLAGIVSHDLRNPLTVLDGQLELAKADCESDHLDAMGRSIDRMDELIDDLLTLAREGDNEPQIAAVDLPEIARTCWHHVATRGATLDVQTEQTIAADENQLQRLLENLFHNAVEHGGEVVTITVGGLENGFYVADDGQGISEDVRDAVLEHGFSTKTSGTGLGLSIVDEVVTNHDWRLDVAEGANGGARFEITAVETAD